MTKKPFVVVDWRKAKNPGDLGIVVYRASSELKASIWIQKHGYPLAVFRGDYSITRREQE